MPKPDSAFRYLLGGVKTPVDAGEADICNLAADQMKRKGISTRSLHFRLYKRSVDARRREDVCFVCTVLVESPVPIPQNLQKRAELRPLSETVPEIVR